MTPRMLALMAIVISVPIGLPVLAGAQPVPQHLLPQSLMIAQKEALEQLSALSRRKGPVGLAANRALVLYRKHVEREQAFIFPPLTLLPDIADGKVTPDMAWALAMTDRVRNEREEIFEEHVQITEALNELVLAAAKAHDNDAKEFAEGAVADSLGDLEILEPTLLIIGDILRARLPAGH